MRTLACIVSALLGSVAASCAAPEVTFKVVSDAGEPLENAVVTFIPADGAGPVEPRDSIIEQSGKKFVPSLLVVPVGSRVRFPNRDEVAHHVYSFSGPKKFDLPLYVGEMADAVLFDRPGVVALGCNIHDWMVAHIFITPTPFYAVSGGDGLARLRGLPPGPGTVEVWHARLRGKAVVLERPARGGGPTEVVLRLRPEVRRTESSPPRKRSGAYR
jgi:plastocyanin